MPIPVDELTDIDYEILDYLNKFDSISKEQLVKHFSNKFDAFEYRLEKLSEFEYKHSSHGFSRPIKNSSYIVEEYEEYADHTGSISFKRKDSFHISLLGKKALQDYRVQSKSGRRKLWKENAWIPIIVAFVTTVITNYIVPTLPLIIKWFVDFFSKTP